MSTPEPGWYPDPNPVAPPGFVRWWDGGRWSEHVRPEQAVAGGVARRQRPTTPDGQPLAGWWWRVLAYVVDGVVLTTVGYLVSFPAQLDLQRRMAENQSRMLEGAQRGEPFSLGDVWAPMMEAYRDHLLLLVVVPIVVGLAYHVGFLRWRGATLGKLMCGLRVRRRDEDGRLGWGTIAVRLLATLGPTFVVLVLGVATGSAAVFMLAQGVVGLYFFVDVLVATGARRQAIHDRVARTVVVATR